MDLLSVLAYNSERSVLCHNLGMETCPPSVLVAPANSAALAPAPANSVLTALAYIFLDSDLPLSTMQFGPDQSIKILLF